MNTNMSTFSGSKDERFLFAMFPAELNTRSTGALVEGMQNNLRTAISRAGNFGISFLHHCNWLVSDSASGSLRK